jgi:dihydrodipicolinate synthase/N-acetylneuraminate lyase
VAQYTKQEARDWAKENLVGVTGCLLPTFSSSIRHLNEAAIRHDVRRSAELGFGGTLLVSETGTTLDEMRQFMDIATDEAASAGIRTMLHASFPTLEDTVEMVQHADGAGVDVVLLSYPLTYYPQTEQEVYDFTRTVAEASDLGIILFAIYLWGFGRIHPSGFPTTLIRRLLDDVPNICAIKNEVGYPGVGGVGEIFHRFRDEVVVTDPFEINSPAWVTAFDMQFLGTSNYEYMGDRIPRYFDWLRAGKFDDAMEIYWSLQPAREANASIAGGYRGVGLINRLAWKYQGWLNGFNGGPIRQPHLRLWDGQMRTLRAGLEATGAKPAPGTDAEFWIGRNPME